MSELMEIKKKFSLEELSELDFSHYFRWLFANFRECSLIS